MRLSSCVGGLAAVALLGGCASVDTRTAPQRLGGRGHDIAYAVAVAPDGGARVAMELTGPLLGGSAPHEAHRRNAARSPDKDVPERARVEQGSILPPPIDVPRARIAAIVAYDSHARQRWAARLAGGHGISPRAVSVAADGTTYAAGWFQQQIASLDTSIAPLASAGGADAFVVALDRGGRPRWLHGIGGPLADNAVAVVAAADSGCFVAGSFSGKAGAGAAAAERLSAVGAADTYVRRLDAAGGVRWTATFGGSGSDEPIALAQSANGDLYLLLRFSADVEVATMQGSQRFGVRGGDDGLLLRLDGDGRVVRAVAIGSDKPDNLTALAADERGAVVIGTLAGARELRIGDRTTTFTSRGAADALLLRFDRDLRWQAQGRVSGNGAVNVASAVVDAGGHLWIAGSYNGQLHVGERDLDADGADGVVVGFDESLRPAAVQTFAGQGVQQVYALAAGHGRLVAAGTFTKELVAKPGTGPLASHGRSDAFLMPFAPPH